MSELAFDCNGDPFSFARLTKRLRVRLFRNPGMRGAPEALQDDDGNILFVPVTLSLLEFRRRVGNQPGRYRLDQCDEDGNPIKETHGKDATPAYVTIVNPRNAGGGAGISEDRESVILARANADVMRAMAESFDKLATGQAAMMHAAANLLASADGAGLPARKPRRVVEPIEIVPTDDDDDGDDVPHPLMAFACEVAPMVGAYVASKFAPPPPPPPPPPAATPAPGPAPTPAPAAAPSAAPAASAAAGSSTSPGSSGAEPPSAPPHAAPSGSVVDESSPADGAEAPSVAPSDPTATPTPAPRNGAMPTTAQWTHLLAIRARLTPREAKIAETAVIRMTTDVRAQWLAELSALSVEEGVSAVRSMMPTMPARPPELGEGT